MVMRRGGKLWRSNHQNGGAEVHNIAAVMGGLASQEAVKLITHQYVPLNNTWIFNGVNCHSVALEL